MKTAMTINSVEYDYIAEQQNRQTIINSYCIRFGFIRYIHICFMYIYIVLAPTKNIMNREIHETLSHVRDSTRWRFS